MKQKLLISLGALVLVGACKDIDGNYFPACRAFAGDTIKIVGDTFVWDKFTDAVEVDDDGNTVDPYPGYPAEGSVSRDGHKLSFAAGGGIELPDMFMQQCDGRPYLLTADENREFDKTGKCGRCSLALQQN